MVELKDNQFVINGEPKLIMAGEIHYFRLPQNEWEDRILKLKEAGGNAVATYIPWLCHEPVEGQFDFGEQNDRLDLDHFMKLCQKHGLYFIPRPGPFIMAEMKNEGIPYWVAETYPEIVPVTWGDRVTPNPTLDYLSPNFLKATKAWYSRIIPLLVPYLIENGGHIIGLQLDNEIGMLSWVSNSPDLTEHVIEDFTKWLAGQYEGDVLTSRYPISLEEMRDSPSYLRSPQESYALALRHDLGYYMRHRTAVYITMLRSYAETYGIQNIPFIVNVHGTGGGRGFTYPIGISQLYESYIQEADYFPGSDIYFGDFNMDMFQDLYLCNAFMKAVNRDGQPISSMEFNCGDGNFGENFGSRYDVSAADLKTRLCIAQENRLLNYYLFAGGYNYEMEPARHDGNNRIAFTGERHGFAAPIDPEGEYNYTFPRMQESIQAVMAVERQLATMNEEHDAVRFAFIPDYYMTEFRYPESESMQRVSANLEANRSTGSWEIVARNLLLNQYRFDALDIQNKTFTPADTPALIVPSATYMSASLQQKLVDYLTAGGNVFFFGEMPHYDMEANPCTHIVDAMKMTLLEQKQASPHYFLSVIGEGVPEVRTHALQLYRVEDGTGILYEKESGEMCAGMTVVGKGRAMFMTTGYRGDLAFFKRLFTQLGAVPQLTHDYSKHGIVMTSTANDSGERFIHLMNLDGHSKSFHVSEKGSLLFDGQIVHLGSRRGLMLPIRLSLSKGELRFATTEIKQIEAGAVTFRITDQPKVVASFSGVSIQPHESYVIEQNDDVTTVTSTTDGRCSETWTIYFN